MQSETLLITLPEGEPRQVQRPSTVRDLMPTGDTNGPAILGALVNNDVCSLSYPLEINAQLRFLTGLDRDGYRIYKRSLLFLVCKVLREQLPDVEFSVGNALHTSVFINYNREGQPGVSEADLTLLREQLQANITANLPIERQRLGFQETHDLLECEGQDDKLNLLRYRNPPQVTVFRCGKYWDIYNGVLADTTGKLDKWELHAYRNGLVLHFPVRRDEELVMEPFHPHQHLHEIFERHKKWGKTVGINFLGDLNQRVAENELDQLILTTEAMHETRLVKMASDIAEHQDRVKWIFLAGPSSAGKTTSSRRLAIHLMVHGLQPIPLECDNYFVNRDKTPTDDKGELDFEHIDAVDLDLLHEHLDLLNRGEAVELPRFNFHEGRQEKSGRILKLEPDQIAIMEGIHCLNPRLSESIPEDSKYRLYLSCLTQLSLDRTNRMSTTDMRLIRRIVRDHRDRGHNALATLRMWPKVRRGEQRWIFPFQDHADATFNTSLDYELAILKPRVSPLLAEIKPYHEEYAEARRLLDLLEMVVSGSSQAVPPSSLIREFIGGSVLDRLH